MTTKEAIKIIESRLKFLARANITAGESAIDLLKLSLAALRAQEERENPERLTIEQMKNMDCPVWVSYKPIAKGYRNGNWCLCVHGKIITPQRTVFDVEQIPDWKFYRYERKDV